MHGADLVAVGVAQIGDIEFVAGAFANARRILARRRTMGDAGRMPGVGLLGGSGGKADGAAVRKRRRLAVDRLRYRKRAGLGEIENTMAVDLGGADIERAEQRVIERLGPVQVVGPDHDVREHSSVSSPSIPKVSRTFDAGR